MEQKISHEELLQMKSECVLDFDANKFKNPATSYYHQEQHPESGKMRLTGWDKNKCIAPGKTILFDQVIYKCIDIAYRDHAGTFPDPQDKIGTFFDGMFEFVTSTKPKGEQR